MLIGNRAPFGRHLGRKPVTLAGRQPLCLFRPVCQVEDRDDAEDNRGNRFQNEHPLPTPHAQPVEAEKG